MALGNFETMTPDYRKSFLKDLVGASIHFSASPFLELIKPRERGVYWANPYKWYEPFPKKEEFVEVKIVQVLCSLDGRILNPELLDDYEDEAFPTTLPGFRFRKLKDGAYIGW